MSTTGNTTQSPQHLRIFLASPGDVADERALAVRVLNNLPSDPLLRGKLTLEAVAWDHPDTKTPFLAGMSAQDSVIRSLGKPSGCDIVVVIVWSRLGSPIEQPQYVKPDGSGYLSGTEWEYEDAWQAYRKKGKPLLLFYHRTSDPNVQLNPVNRKAILDRLDQLESVATFLSACHQRDGSIPNEYQTPSEFEENLRNHLKEQIRDLLERREVFQKVSVVTLPPIWRGSPFPGLRAFTPADAPIFFGRGRETDGLVSRLDNPALRFLTVVGASGSGKSSLVAAGLIPRLLAGAMVGSQDWVWVRFTPGEVGDNPFMALALSFKEVLQQAGQLPREVADRLEKTPATLIELRDWALAGKPEWAELLLFLDQFEELFTLAASRYVGPFVEWLHQAAQTERMRIVATLRADFYHRCVEQPVLAHLFTGSYNLAAPGPEALHEMITRPAERAGLTFEAGLIDQILTDTGTEPGALALLAFALAELYKGKTPEGRLTWAAYKGFNRVQGVIAKRAEDIFNTLDADAQAALSDVFRNLVEVDEGGVATRRRAARHHVSRSVAAAEQLIDRFTDARLLVTSGEDDPTVEVAHEALLRSWPRLADWIESVRDDLYLRSQLQRDAVTWQAHGDDDNYRWANERVVATGRMLDRLCYPPNELEQRFLGPLDPKQMRVLLDDLDTPAELRETIGVRLALLGDSRPGIGLGADDLPDFRWASIPGTEAVRASGWFPNLTGFRLGNGARTDLEDPDAYGSEDWPKEAAPLEITAFELTIYPVTVTQFRPFVEQGGYRDNRYWSKTGWLYRGDGPGWWKNKTWTLSNQPVIGVTWYAVQAYCNWLNDQLRLPRGTLRLPTEAEWEWAARGPEGRRYPWGEDWDTRRGNSLEAGLDCTSAVGCFPGGAGDWWRVLQPDSEVVHDLAGNVWEWTASEYRKDYSTAHESVLNTDHPVDRPCVRRGGSWNDGPSALRGAARDGYNPRFGGLTRGFRLARTFP